MLIRIIGIVSQIYKNNWEREGEGGIYYLGVKEL